MARLPELDPAALTPPQRAVYERIASGPRGRVRGPLLAWLHSPGFAAAVHPIGEYLRYESLLAGRLAELAILAVGRHWDADFEWYVHAPLAEKAGVAREVIDAIAVRATPAFTREDERAVWQVVTTLLEQRRVPQVLFEDAERILGRPALVELSGLVGYYSLGAFTLHLFEVEPPPGAGPRLPLLPPATPKEPT